jgi:hypothetical protein
MPAFSMQAISVVVPKWIGPLRHESIIPSLDNHRVPFSFRGLDFREALRVASAHDDEQLSLLAVRDWR